MQNALKVLAVVVFLMSVFLLSFSAMVAYTNKDLRQRNSAIKQEVSALTQRKRDLSEARAKGADQDQGIEFWEKELGKAKAANDRIETKDLPATMEDLKRRFGQQRDAFEKLEEENLKYGERTLTEKLRSAKDLRAKVEEARVNWDKTKKENEAQEKLKADLRNQLQQAEHILDDLKKRNESLKQQITHAKKAES